MESRLRRALLVGSIWLLMTGWELVDLVGRLRDPRLDVDSGHLVLALGCVVLAVPVGSLVGGLLALSGKPPRDPEVDVIWMAQTTACSASLGVLVVLGHTVVRPGAGFVIGSWVPALLTGMILGFGVAHCVVLVLRQRSSLREPPVQEVLRWDLAEIEPLP